MVFERAKGMVRKVTFELVYDVVDERTKEIIHKIEEIDGKREEDFRYLNQRIDQLRQELKGDIDRLRQEMSGINRRIDTVIQMLSDIGRRQ